MPDTVNKYDSLYQEMLSNIVKEKGGSPEIYNNLLNKIGFMESGLDPTIKQRSGGPGRGKYQFETGMGYEKAYDSDGNHKPGHFKGTSNRIFYSAVRTKNYLKTLGKKIPDYINNIIDNETGDASTLSESQQDILALGDLRMGKVDLSDYASGNLSGKDIYINNWWAGNDSEHREKLNKRWDSRDADFKNTSHYQPTEKDYQPKMSQNDKSSMAIQQPFTQQSSNQQSQRPMIDDRVSSPEFTKGKFDEFLNERFNKINQKPAISSQAKGTEMAQGGMLNHFKGGGTHEQNPLGGIPQGMGANGAPNTVEEDETSYDFPEGKFIFSNRIFTDGKGSFSNTTSNKMADGGKLNSNCGGKGQPPCKDPKQWTLDYISSDKYKNRLVNSGYDNVDNLIKKRKNKVQNVKIKNQEREPDFLDKVLNTLKGEDYTDGTSRYNYDKNSIILDKKQIKKLNAKSENVEAHEIAHAESSLFDKNISLNKYDKDQIKKRYSKRYFEFYKKNKHNSSPHEVKADLNALKYQLYKEGIDLDKNDFTKEMLYQTDNKFIMKRLWDKFEEEDLVWLMNNIASNEKPKKNNIA